MRDITKKYGENAGKIWSVLNDQGSLQKDQVLELTRMDEEEDTRYSTNWQGGC